MLERLRTVARDAGSIVLVTHDPGEILPEIDRVILLESGRVVADGAKKDILKPEILSNIYGMDLMLRWLEGWPVVRPVR